MSGEVTGIDTSAQTMVTVVLHYMKQTQPESPEVLKILYRRCMSGLYIFYLGLLIDRVPYLFGYKTGFSSL